MIAVLGLALLAACSVSTPRNGFSESAQGVSAGEGSPEAITQGPGAGAGSAAGASADAADVSPDGTAVSGETGSGSAGGTSGGAAGNTAATPTEDQADPAATGGAVGGTPAGTGGGGRTGPAAPPAVGVTDKTITVSVIAPFSGPYGAIFSNLYDNGWMTWVDEVNGKGGVHGRQVISKKIDNRNTVEGAIAACEEVKANNTYLSLLGFGQNGSDVAVVDCLEKAGKTIIASPSAFSNDWKHVYATSLPTKFGYPTASFIRNVIGDKSEKIGIIYLGDDPVMRSTREGVLAGLKDYGLEPIHEEEVQANQGAFVSELTRMRAAGATTVSFIGGAEILGILRDAKAIGYSPNWTGLWWPTDEFSTAGRNLMAGVRAYRGFASTNAPAYEEYRKKAAARNRGGVINSTTATFYSTGLFVGQVLQNVGPQPATEKLGPAIESIVDFDTGISSTTFGKGVRVATPSMFPLECCNSDGTWKGIGPARQKF